MYLVFIVMQKIKNNIRFTKTKKKHLILNICSNKPVHLTKVIRQINKHTKRKLNILKRSLQKVDIIKTHGDNSLIKKITGIKKFTSIEEGIKNTVNWYVKNNKY